MLRWRLFLAAVLLALLVPGHFLRTAPRVSEIPAVTLLPLELESAAGLPDGMHLSGIWEITANDWHLGGWSALVARPDGQIEAFSDRGTRAVLDPSGAPHAAERVRLPRIPARRAYIVDIEAATVDRSTGTQWLALEYHNAIVRFAANGDAAFRQPPAMRHWSANTGSEAMARLPDGRFIVFSEGGGGLVFPQDPVEGGTPVAFGFSPPDGFQPTDATMLPDGRLLILLRRLRARFPPFDATLALADPAQLGSDTNLEMDVLARLVPGLPSENYEGLAVTPAADGTLDIWLVSDDNQAAFQRSLLARINWRSAKSAKEKGARIAPDALSNSSGD